MIHPRTRCAAWARRALDLLDPPQCLACQRGLAVGASLELLLCEACRRVVEHPQPRCGGCGVILQQPERPLRCGPCRVSAAPWDELVVFADYVAPLDTVVRAFKFRGLFFLGEQLGRRLAHRVAPLGAQIDVVVAVPMPWLRRCRRGLDHAEILAHEVATLLGKPLMPVLHRHHWARLAGRSAQGRRFGRHGFALRRGRTVPARVLLVDDVLTTGATLRACVLLLRQAGAQQVMVATVARTPAPHERHLLKTPGTAVA